MFENATLVSAPPGRRAWTTIAGMTSQVLLVGLAVVVPMVFPQVMPQAQLLTSLAPPLPPAPKSRGTEAKPRPVTHTAAVRTQFNGRTLTWPTQVPPRAVMIQDEPTDFDRIGVPGGDPRGVENGVRNSLFSDSLFAPATPYIPPVKPPETVKAPPVVEAPKAYPVGGDVHLGRLLRKVEPRYPTLAISAHVSGTVEFECLVGADGRVKQVKVVSGNPLLVGAARDAIFQWIYEGSKLNGVPIDIIAKISVNFKLN